MSDSEQRALHVQTPDIPGGAEAATTIIKILQREPIDLTEIRLDDVFFSVLQSFRQQADALGFTDDDNPFTPIEEELRAYLEHSRANELAHIPEAYRADMRRFLHMREEAHHDAGLLVPAVRILETLAEQVDPQTETDFWGELHNELGTTYVELPVANREKALTRAIAALKTALAARPPEKDPYKHLSALHNLGNAYLNSPLGNRTEQLAAALANFEAARRYVDKQKMRGDYAILMVNLGTALALLPLGDRAANLGRAEQCFAEAVQIFNPDFAAGWALVQSRWAQALHYGQPADLQRAIFFYDNALSIYTAEQDSLRWDHIAVTVQRVLAALAHDPSAKASAREQLLPLLPLLEPPRTSQQHAQLNMAFGPYYNGQPRLAQGTILSAKLQAARDATTISTCALQLICFDPAKAAEHLQTALTALN